MKVTNVQKCDFSQSRTLSFQKLPGEHAPDPLEGLKNFFSLLRGSKNSFQIDSPPPKTKILDRTLTTMSKSTTLGIQNLFSNVKSFRKLDSHSQLDLRLQRTVHKCKFFTPRIVEEFKFWYLNHHFNKIKLTKIIRCLQ